MITTFIRSSIFLFVTVLVTSMFLVSPITASAQIWNPPTGAPPQNNAPEPIHQGLLGQGKYWGDLSGSSYTIGAFLFIAEGLLSDWVIADNQGIAATQFCLGSESAIETSGFPGGTTGLSCITVDTGWPGGGGGGGGNTFPPATAGQTLYYNEALGEWQASEFHRSIDGGVGEEADKIMFGYQSPLGGGVETNVSIHGALKYTVPGQPGSFYNGKILGNTGVGNVTWVDPSAVNLGLPEGDAGNIMYWNETESAWVADNSFYVHQPGQGDRTSIINHIGFSNLNIPGNDYLDCLGDQTIRLAGGSSQGADIFDCTDKLTINESNDVVTVDTQNAIFTKLIHTMADAHPVCAENDGDLTLCGNLSTGDWEESTAGTYTFTVPSGVYEINATLTGGGGGGGGGGFGKSLYILGDVYALTAMGGGGGGGGGGKGQTVTQTIAVEPGQELSITVGSGGLGGCPYRAAIASGGSNNGCNDGPAASLNSTLLYNGASGQNGGNSVINPEVGPNIVASGGFGGEGGFGFDPSLPGLAFEVASPGGEPGDDWNGSTVATDGQNGENHTPDEENDDDYIQSDNWNGGNPDHQWPVVSCLKQRYIAGGGAGGDGSGGNQGGDGGISYLHGSFEPGNCGDANYLTLSGGNAIGDNGNNGPLGSGEGAGGGGGGSSIAGTFSQTGLGTVNELGYGGFGGDGGSGKVILSW